ncbi:globin-like protein [Metschnikowia bicuspidata]|uniref:Globin-like protein n=1 Tax=Metschnikowia bicuspidata TaxID=27322 RepID=A0A4P9ZGM3_9ASCO|nr:globin-like protein [Metschnikowia bicuspidata]
MNNLQSKQHNIVPRLSVNSRKPRVSSTASVARRSIAPSKIEPMAQKQDPRSLRSVASQQSAPSVNSKNDDGYFLSRVDSTTSMGLMLSMQSQYRVNISLLRQEISLLRYMWNKMLVEELLEDPRGAGAALAPPGSLWNIVKNKPITYTQRSIKASSMFCLQLYLNLLSRAPELDVAFPSLRHQAVSLAGTITFAINSLENLSSLDEYLSELAKRHLRILGTEPAQFELMGEAFIHTFQERFGKRFTPELEILWIKFYLYLANTLLQFGMDPVLKLESDNLSPLELELIATTDDDFSVQNSARQNSLSTEVISTVRTAADSDCSFLSPLRPGASKDQKPKTKKKKTHIKKKGDCVIV